MKLTLKQINAGATCQETKTGFNNQQFLALGIIPNRGWKKRVMKMDITEQQYQYFLEKKRVRSPKSEKAKTLKKERLDAKKKRAKRRRINRKKLPKDLYNSNKWLKLRYKVLSKYKAKCMLCNATREDGVHMHVDHIKPVSIYPELAFDEDNLQILCAKCNLGKSNLTEEDWRIK